MNMERENGILRKALEGIRDHTPESPACRKHKGSCVTCPVEKDCCYQQEVAREALERARRGR